MFPIGDDNPQIHRPLVTYGIIAFNIIAWLFLQGAGFGADLYHSICDYGLIPADLVGSTSVTVPSSSYSCDGSAGWPSLLSSMFIHSGWMHLIGNMWFLFVFGDNVEDAMGPLRYAIFYPCCGLFAAAAQILANPDSTIPMVGASGAVGGIMGAYIMLYPRVQVNMVLTLFIIFWTFRLPAMAMLGYWIVIQILGGVTSMGATGGGTAFWAHVGGFFAGAGLVWMFKNERLLANHPFRGWRG